ncbi:MAG: GNAT family N-acetyltransferase [Bacteroidetes bacterium]|nr:MAG: GNAT family N-acetyltransferase [Bacteroidota bacterium]
MLSNTSSAQKILTDPNKGTYRFSYFRSIEAAGKDWDMVAPEHDLFLQREYLSVLESTPPLGMRFGYLVFYLGDDPIGIALCQIKYFKGDDNINAEALQTKDPCFFASLSKWLKRWVAGKMAADILICGNMLLTGEHGYWFDYSRISRQSAAVLLEDALNAIAKAAEKDGIRMPVILVKDIVPDLREQGHFLVNRGFTEFEIQPNMVLQLPFRTFDAYLEAMSTKYRTRAKRAFKKAADVEKRELSLHEIQQELPRIYNLYRDIANNAGFNMVDLNEHYLPALKRQFPKAFRMFGYYLEGRLVAFYTTIQNGSTLEAHFLGYEKDLNHDRQLYLNILYDIVRIGIEHDCEQVVFARTALEIKSSVGAVPEDLYCYLRHQNNLANHFTGTLLDYLKPVEEWQIRHPFKTEQVAEDA